MFIVGMRQKCPEMMRGITGRWKLQSLQNKRQIQQKRREINHRINELEVIGRTLIQKKLAGSRRL